MKRLLLLLTCLIIVCSLVACIQITPQDNQGIQGLPGADGKDGKDGVDGITPTIEISEDGYWIINGIKTEYKAIGQDGKDGIDGEDGKDGATGKDGVDGANGKDGIDGAPGKDGVDGITPTIEISADGYWIINGVKTEYKAIGQDGKDGIDGEDGKDGTPGKDGVDGITPTIEISEDGYWIINGVKTEYRVNADEIKCEHSYVEAYVVEYTCTEKKILKSCEKCEKLVLVSEKIPANHIDDNGKCEKCGEFLYSSGLEYTLQSDNTYAVTDIGECTDTDIVIPDTYLGLPVTSIDDSAFSDPYDEFESITIPDSVTYIDDYAFIGCLKLQNFIVDENNTEYKAIDGNLYTKDGKKLISYAIGKKQASFVIPNGVTEIGDAAFVFCIKLASVTIPESVSHIGEHAFDFEGEKSSLVEIINKSSLNITAGSEDYGYVAYSALNVHNGESKVVVDGDYAFYTHEGVNYLVSYLGTDTSITLPESYNGEDYEIGTGAFLFELNLTEVHIPNGVTSIGDWAFPVCHNLTSVVIGDSVTTIGDRAFYYCSNLTSVVIGDSVTTIGNNAFESCYNLTSVVIGNSVTTIGDYAFYRCSNLTSVNISSIYSWCNISFGESYANPLYYARNLYLNGELVTKLVIPDGITEIKDNSFFLCDNLTSVIIPDSVTSIGNSAFSGCSNLTSVVIGDSVTTIGSQAFHYCSNLPSVYYNGTAEDWANITIGSWNSELTIATRYYYSETEPTESGNYWHYDGNDDIAVW